MGKIMSHLVCPLCGKNAPLSKFDPEYLDLDISLVSFRGLGRGRGFEVADRVSVLGDDDITPKVLNRVVEICKMFISEGIIDPVSLSNNLGLTGAITSASGINQYKQENTLLRNQLNASQKQLQDERISAEEISEQLRKKNRNLTSSRKSQAKELEEKESQLAEIEEELDDIVETIEQYTEYEHDPFEDSSVVFITQCVEKILEDLEALKAGIEDE
jgi:uncharacterized FlaG/YvyC family protein